MYISYIIYIILNSRCYTGVRAPKLSHRSSFIKEPFGKGLDGLPGGWTGGFRRAWRRLAGLEARSRGLEKGFKGLEKGFRGARWLAWRGLQGGLRRASRGLQGGLRRAWRGLQGGLKGAWEGLQGGFKGAWEGLQGGFKRASSPSHLRAPPSPRGGTLQAPLEGYLRRWWLGASRSTSAFTAANGLSRAIATSISPPSFLVIADFPACVLFKIAKALFSQMHLSHSSVALWACDPVWGGARLASEVPSTRRNTLSGSWAVGLLAAAAAARRMSSSVTSVELVNFFGYICCGPPTVGPGGSHVWVPCTIGSTPLCVTIGLLCSWSQLDPASCHMRWEGHQALAAW